MVLSVHSGTLTEVVTQGTYDTKRGQGTVVGVFDETRDQNRLGESRVDWKAVLQENGKRIDVNFRSLSCKE